MTNYYNEVIYTGTQLRVQVGSKNSNTTSTRFIVQSANGFVWGRSNSDFFETILIHHIINLSESYGTSK